MDKDLYRELGTLTKRKEDWKDTIPFVGSLLENQSPNITAKALWLLGEMGLQYPEEIEPYVASIASFLYSELLHDRDDKVRMEAPEMFRVLGKRRPHFVKPYLELLRNISETDSNRVVRIHCLGAVRAAGGDSLFL